MKDIIRFISVACLIITLGCATTVPPIPVNHDTIEVVATPNALHSAPSTPTVGLSYHHYMQDRCQWCGSTQNLNVHHIEPQHLHPELRDVPSNLVTLCRECHFILGHKRNWTNEVPEISVLFKQTTTVRATRMSPQQ